MIDKEKNKIIVKGKNISGLKEASDSRHSELLKKVNPAIDKLKKSKTIEFNFSNIAKEAGISRASLYDKGEIEERIRGIMLSKKALSGGVESKSFETEKLKNDKISALYEKIKELEDDLKKAMYNLIEMEKLKKEVERLNRLLEQSQQREIEFINKIQFISKKDNSD